MALQNLSGEEARRNADDQWRALHRRPDVLPQADAVEAGGHDFTTACHGAGVLVGTWTVDDPVVARRLAEAGVDGITTNRPKWLREQLSAKGH